MIGDFFPVHQCISMNYRYSAIIPKRRIAFFFLRLTFYSLRIESLAYTRYYRYGSIKYRIPS